MPSPVWVAARAITSGTGVVEAESRSAFTPGKLGAGTLFSHWYWSARFTGANGPDGVTVTRKVRTPPAGMSTGVSDRPIGWLVVGLVVW